MEIMKLLGEVFISWVVAYFVCAFVHEGGHVVAGLLQGWKFYLLVVGPFKLYRDEKDDKVKFGLEKNMVLWGGIGGCIPREEKEDNMKGFAVTLLAGPMASVILGVLCSVSLFFHVSIFGAMMTFLPISMGIICLLPNVKTGILYTDGGRFLRIIKGGKTLEEEKAVYKCSLKDQYRPDDCYDESDIEAMTTSEDLSFQYMGHYYGYMNAKMDQKEEEMQARIANMKNLEEKVPKTIREMCALEG